VRARHTFTEIGRKEEGVLDEPAGLPELRDGEVLPADLHAFYRTCGGLTLHKIRMRVVEPGRFRPLDESGLYLLAERSDAKPAEPVTIDLGSGRCYAGTAVVAESFTSFLVRLAHDGVYWPN
jgi:hypothetical protein